MKIDVVTMPDLRGKSVEQALQLLLDHCHETAVHVMRMSNEIDDLKRQLEEVQRSLVYR